MQRTLYSVGTFFKALRIDAIAVSTSVSTANKDLTQSRILTSQACGLSRLRIQKTCKEWKSQNFHPLLKEVKNNFELRIFLTLTDLSR